MTDAVTMILAPTIREGEAYADAHGYDRDLVISPRSTSRARGRRFDRLVTVNPDDLDLLDRDDINELVGRFLDSTHPDAVAAVKRLMTLRR